MNCCDANGKCTGGAGCAAHSCADEEDVVLAYAARMGSIDCVRTPPAFAPGTIESYRARFWTPARRRSLLRTLQFCSAAGAILAVSAFFAGLIVGAIP